MGSTTPSTAENRLAVILAIGGLLVDCGLYFPYEREPLRRTPASEKLCAEIAAAASTWNTAWPWRRLLHEHSGPPVRLSVCNTTAQAPTTSAARRGRSAAGSSRATRPKP